MGQPVERGRGKQGFAEELWPLRPVAIACQDDRGFFIPFVDDVVKILGPRPPEDLARLGDLAPEHASPVGQALTDLGFQTRDLAVAEASRRIQLDRRVLAAFARRISARR